MHGHYIASFLGALIGCDVALTVVALNSISRMRRDLGALYSAYTLQVSQQMVMREPHAVQPGMP